jgi:hypothetical protein
MPIRLLNSSQIDLVLKEQELREVVAAYKAAARRPAAAQPPPPPLSPKAPPPPVLGVPVALEPEPLDKAARARRCAAGVCTSLSAMLRDWIERRCRAGPSPLNEDEAQPLTRGGGDEGDEALPVGWRTTSALEAEQAMLHVTKKRGAKVSGVVRTL